MFDGLLYIMQIITITERQVHCIKISLRVASQSLISMFGGGGVYFHISNMKNRCINSVMEIELDMLCFGCQTFRSEVTFIFIHQRTVVFVI